MGWIAAVVGVVGAIGSSMSAKSAAKTEAKTKLAQSAAEIKGQRENSQFTAEQDYYYRQLDKQEKMRGLDEFRKFSTVKNFSPNYQNTTAPLVLPAKPVYDAGVYGPDGSGVH